MKRIPVHAAVIVVSLAFGARFGSAQNPMADELRSQWEASRKQITQIAEAMPAEKYQFQATSEVRSFGQIVAHIAGEDMMWMERVAGVPKPGPAERFDNLKTRQEILKALSDQFEYGKKVLATMTDQQVLENVDFNKRQRPRWAIVMQTIGHSKEHYGNLVTYLRLNHIVPPSTVGAGGA